MSDRSLELLESIEARLQRLEARLAPLDAVPDVVATGVNVFDSNVARLQDEGIDLDERLRALMPTLERLTRPETLATLQAATDMLDEAPNLVATITDVADGVIRRLQEDGIDVDARLRSFVKAADMLSRPRVIELLTFVDERGSSILTTVQTLLDAGVFEAKPVQTISAAADALAGASGEDHAPVGAWALLRSLSDPDVARAVSFGREFARRFGSGLQN